MTTFVIRESDSTFVACAGFAAGRIDADPENIDISVNGDVAEWLKAAVC